MSQEDFLTGDDGESLLRAEMHTKTNNSIESIASILESKSLAMPLEVFCNYIAQHKSLRNATIVSTSSYNQRVHLVIRHRFLLLKLRREGKKDIWLRLDRLSSQKVNIIGFLASGGKTEAYDVVSGIDIGVGTLTDSPVYRLGSCRR